MHRRMNSAVGRDEAGFALIIAIITLLLLTFLGLTLAVTTSTELQVARNYQWSQQALYNAEAGLEVGKNLLRSANFTQILPTPRQPPGSIEWDGVTTPGAKASGTWGLNRNDAWGNTSRNFENWQVDVHGNGMGYGVILDTGAADPAAPYQYVTSYTRSGVTTTLNGAFTLWVRRLVTVDSVSGDYEDFQDTNDDTLILVSEGVAPFTGAAITSNLANSQRVTAVLETTVSYVSAQGNCLGRGQGQAGFSNLGGGFIDCPPLGTSGSCQNIGTGGACVQELKP